MKKKRVDTGKKAKIKQRKSYTQEDTWLEEFAVRSVTGNVQSKKDETRHHDKIGRGTRGNECTVWTSHGGWWQNLVCAV
jgi:hypothetical protein